MVDKICVILHVINTHEANRNKMEKNIYDILREECKLQVTTDSRNCPKDSMFIALKGDKFNGNAYAAKALESGCAYALVDEKEYVTSDRTILVEDGLRALQELATEHRDRMKRPVLGITGTNGKTTTKELIAAVLKMKFNVLYTEGNLNNHIGVPLTLLRLREEHDMAIIEMGANHPGEIKQLTAIAKPDCGLITNVGKAHLEGFGSFEKLIATKCEMYDFITSDGRHDNLFVDCDNEILMREAQCRTKSAITYGTNENASVRGELIDSDPYMRFKIMGDKEYEVQTHLVGAYNFKNALAAVAVGRHFDIPMNDIVKAISNYVPTNNRSQLTETATNRLIVDTYNANPTSMMAALENFTMMKADNKMVILGDMRELGAISAEEHQKVADYLKEHDIDEVWLVGEEFGKTDCSYRKFENVASVKETLKETPVTGKTILIKGSNGTRLFELPELL